jgi:hypothetical protein
MEGWYLAGEEVFCLWHQVVRYLVHKSLTLNSIFILDQSPQQSCEMKNINSKREIQDNKYNQLGAQLVEALCYKPEGRGIESR